MKFTILILCTILPASCSIVGGQAGALKTEEKTDEAVNGTAAAHDAREEGKPIYQGLRPQFSAMAAEFVATFLFVSIGCGVAMGTSPKVDSARDLQISMAFAFSMGALIYGIGHYSGGQINPAITLGLVFTGRTTIAQGFLDCIFQLAGAVAGSSFLLAIYDGRQDSTGDLAMNKIEEGWSYAKVLLAEAAMSFMLVFVVLETATNPLSAPSAAMAPVAIGSTVFLAHSVLLPIDGCSVNPARSFAPAVAIKLSKYVPYVDKERFASIEAPFKDQWVFWVGPFAGALVAAGLSAALMA